MTAKGVFLPVGIKPFPVLITLISGNEDGRARCWQVLQCFEDMHRTHYVSGISLNRRLVGESNKRLGGQVENERGRNTLDGLSYRRRVPDISDLMFHSRLQSKLFEQARIGRRVERKAMHAGAQFQKPGREPCPFESGMPGKPDRPSVECAAEHRSYQTFQGARPSRQTVFKRVNSWKVSIGCQKPSCLKAPILPSAAIVLSGSCSSITSGFACR